jgi:hypothetical protein
MSYREKLEKIGPRKLLACDGGGIRGIISIEILAPVESELRKSSLQLLHFRWQVEKFRIA